MLKEEWDSYKSLPPHPLTLTHHQGDLGPIMISLDLGLEIRLVILGG